MIMAQPNDVVTFLCWLDSCSEKRRTAVHARDCEAVGTSELSNYSTTDKAFTLRYAHDSFFEDDLRSKARHGVRTRPGSNTRLE